MYTRHEDNGDGRNQLWNQGVSRYELPDQVKDCYISKKTRFYGFRDSVCVFFFHNSSGAHPASCPVGDGVSFPGGGAVGS
jgi:hypothetical protein